MIFVQPNSLISVCAQMPLDVKRTERLLFYSESLSFICLISDALAYSVILLLHRSIDARSEKSSSKLLEIGERILARALVKRPQMILADEPTAALDYETSIEVLQALEERVAEGMTLVMVTHNEEIAKMANRVIRMKSGVIASIRTNHHPAKAVELSW